MLHFKGESYDCELIIVFVILPTPLPPPIKKRLDFLERQTLKILGEIILMKNTLGLLNNLKINIANPKSL